MILTRIRATIEKYKLLEKGDKVLVAYSGGADSTALVALFLDLRRDYSLELALAHFNHLLRRSAMEDERFAVGVARKYSLPLYLRREDIRGLAKKRRLNIEEAGRERRYEFLRKTAARIGAAKIATGHTMSDQAETLLMRLLRGTGPRGLGGIFPVVEGAVIRPLLEVEREEIEAYLSANGLSYRTDESNLDRRFLRNKVRLQLIPYFKKNFEPRIVPQLCRLAEIIRSEEEFMESAARAEMPRVLLKKKEKIALDAGALSLLPLALARRCVRAFLSQVKGDLRRISFKDVESVLRLRDGKDLHLPESLILRRERGSISLKERPRNDVRYEYSWIGKKALDIKELGLQFCGCRMPRAAVPAFLFNNDQRVYLDGAKLRFPVAVRSRREGDCYRPLGAPGRKQLKEIMRAKGILPGQRPRQPVFLSGGKIVWVLGLPVADEFKVTPQTTNIFIIEKS
jgi:tRNA(Ile)-lysidine synthase